MFLRALFCSIQHLHSWFAKTGGMEFYAFADDLKIYRPVSDDVHVKQLQGSVVLGMEFAAF